MCGEGIVFGGAFLRWAIAQHHIGRGSGDRISARIAHFDIAGRGARKRGDKRFAYRIVIAPTPLIIHKVTR